MYDPVSGSWSFVSDLEKKREGHVAFLVNGTICVMGGLHEGEYVDKIEWYDEVNDEWHKTSMDMPNPVAAPFYTSHNDSLYLFGGFYTAPIATGQLAEVDSGWGFNWYSAPSLQTARGFGASATLGDTLFMIGGTTLSGATDLVEIFHLDTQLLETFTPAPTARIGMTAVALDHSIYVIGGYTQDTNIPTNLVEIYSNITDISQIPPNIPLTFAQIEGYPNPFNGAITLEVLLPVRTEVEISIYNLLGERISGLYQGALGSGKYTFRWDGKNDQGSHVSSGIYIAVLKSKDYLRSFRMVYIK
ncbi:MAG: T9SS C-terminal target domain-containing protein [Methanobacteriota archaeon]|nr:MAG: T9SS C-terminal target domain-containing protein [Euryarchaeota archaeon]